MGSGLEPVLVLGLVLGLGLIDPCWVGFHIALKVFPFLSCRTGDFKAGATAAGPKKV
jgi:hypothetical protein